MLFRRRDVPAKTIVNSFDEFLRVLQIVVAKSDVFVDRKNSFNDLRVYRRLRLAAGDFIAAGSFSVVNRIGKELNTFMWVVIQPIDESIGAGSVSIFPAHRNATDIG
jgi:hypothetical protein